MTRRSVFAQPIITRLPQLLAEVKSGEILIPAFQRPFEWEEERRILLLDSIVRGVPIGSLLVWRTSKHDLDCFPKLGHIELPEPPDARPRHYLIDGHQRLTTLYAALSDPATIVAHADAEGWPIYYDLEVEEGERAFTILRGKQPARDTLLPAPALLSPELLWRAQRGLFEAGKNTAAKRVEELANTFKDYQIPVLPLVTEDMDIVTDAFVRINSGGRKMAETYMVQALAYSRFRMRDRSDTIRDNLADLGWGELDDRVILSTLKLRWDIEIYGSRPEAMLEHIEGEQREDESDEQVFERIFDELEDQFKAVIGLLRRCEVWGPAALPYIYQFVALAEVRRRLGSDEAFEAASERLIRWFWLTSFIGHFTGMTSKMIREATEHLFEVADGELEAFADSDDLELPALRQHNFSSVRTKVRALYLLGQIQDERLRQERGRLLGELGSNALQKITPSMSGSHPGARVIADSAALTRLREALFSPGTTDREQLLAQHAIPSDALAELEQGETQDFLELREQHLAEGERAFFERQLPNH
ncbi:DUF262 domain-containing protein [Pseudenhygromyxa sp. WMMC2535]|uniref:DUF262 domain-containing protein n=1 Tax=Pseudenhygromyxa sp. WMMC2535 TaxID=2712867 RepID=UPI001555E66D|nr:DUF262 domain-containing protein [Pseudenhygromyxa sp. WMMC2535]NVB42822.1 DUF262 domain-containing protein [Pseudenhygromyxa sp. WMMC2535]